MQIKELKLLFSTGTLKQCTVVPIPMGSGYYLQVDEHVLEIQRDGNREFKSIDAACNAARTIGFKTAIVQL